VVVSSLLHMADCLVSAGHTSMALHAYDSAENIATSAKDPHLQSLVASSAAEFQERLGNFGEALRLYQEALHMDSASSPDLEATDLIGYAQLLRAHHLDTMAYACLLRAQQMVGRNQAAPEFSVVDKNLKNIEAESPTAELAAVRRDPNAALSQALSLNK
jgi:tetratricopeptide (TPR) repeat protein